MIIEMDTLVLSMFAFAVVWIVVLTVHIIRQDFIIHCQTNELAKKPKKDLRYNNNTKRIKNDYWYFD